MLIGHIAYGYEYFGLTERLVITQAIEKLHLAIAYSLSINMGCVFNGSAKTETIMDLAKAIALFSIICYCNELSDLESIRAKLFGAIQCKGWACLSSLNNLNIAVLEAVYASIHTISEAWIAKQSKFQVISIHFFLKLKIKYF